jgi:hypothetical protein
VEAQNNNINKAAAAAVPTIETSNMANNIRRQSSQASIASKSEWVKLNVGGQYFLTTKTTLCKNPQSFFYKLCQDDPSIGLTTDKVIN